MSSHPCKWPTLGHPIPPSFGVNWPRGWCSLANDQIPNDLGLGPVCNFRSDPRLSSV